MIGKLPTIPTIANLQEVITNSIVSALKTSIVNFLKWIFIGALNSSYWICLTAALIAILIYIAGERRAGKYVTISFVVYFILQAVKEVVL